MANIALTSLCKDCLVATAALPIALLSIQNQENPIWQQHLEAVSDLKSPHFHTGMTSLAKYAQYLFNLHHNTGRTARHQRTRLMAYEESATATAQEMERLRHENAILRSVQGHLQSWTTSYRRFTVALVALSMDGTTLICCSTSLVMSWISVPMGSSTLRTT
jgi:hypothetical protein